MRAAEEFRHIGFVPGDKVAIVGEGTVAYWAYLAKLRIVAEIMDAHHGIQEFWAASAESKQRAYDAFRTAHAKIAVSQCPPSKSDEWQRLSDTTLCLHPLN